MTLLATLAKFCVKQYIITFVFPVRINLVSSLSKTSVFSARAVYCSLGLAHFRSTPPCGIFAVLKFFSLVAVVDFISLSSTSHSLTKFHLYRISQKKKVATRPQSCYGEKEWRKISNKEIWLYYYNSHLVVYITYILLIY